MRRFIYCLLEVSFLVLASILLSEIMPKLVIYYKIDLIIVSILSGLIFYRCGYLANGIIGIFFILFKLIGLLMFVFTNISLMEREYFSDLAIGFFYDYLVVVIALNAGTLMRKKFHGHKVNMKGQR